MLEIGASRSATRILRMGVGKCGVRLGRQPTGCHYLHHQRNSNEWGALGEDEMIEFALQIGAALRRDAERYRRLAARATQQADSIGSIFRIDVRRKKDGTPFSVGAAIDVAMQGGQK